MNKNEQFVITLNRELGSGGHTVGRLLAEKLHVTYYDKAVINALTDRLGMTVEESKPSREKNAPGGMSSAVVPAYRCLMVVCLS